MSRSHVSNTTLTLGSTGAPATPQGKKMVWNRRKQEWMEVEAGAEQTTPGRGASPTSNLLSSNAYASGVNQNAGNFLTEKPITRIHAPPGGRSTISFGDYTEPAASTPARKASPTASVATPTQPTTPESLDETDVPAPIPMMELPPVPTVEGGAEEGEEEEEDATAAEIAPPAPPAVAEAVAAAVPGVSANAYASGSNQNSGNFMTGRPTTRVRAPPGGASSITFG